MRLASNGFWLMLPVLLLNLAAAGNLPEALSEGEFWEGVPGWISWSENISRLLLVALPVTMQVDLNGRHGRLGVIVYLVGLTCYGVSLFALALAPNSAWSESTMGLVMPALLPSLWLAGMALLLRPTSALRFPPWLFGCIAILFLLFHQIHALGKLTAQ